MTKVLSWRVVLSDTEMPSFKSEYTVVAQDAGAAEAKALKIQGPVNNGLGRVYNLQAVFVKLLTVAEE